MFAKIQRIHFVGIGGIGMSGIAQVLLNLGYKISRAHLKRSLDTDRVKTLDAMGSNARLGRSQYLVAEADESDRSFLKLSPILAVVTNIDREHMDCYRNMHDVKRAFLDFMDRVPFYGMIVACNDDPVLRRLFPKIQRRMGSYGTRKGADFRIALKNTELWSAGRPRPAGVENGRAGTPVSPLVHFDVKFRGKELGDFRLHVPGVHNVLTATAASAAGIGFDHSR